MIKVGSDFSGVGAFNQALIRLGIPYKEVFVCDIDKYARQTFIHNYGEPDYYPENVYDRDIPKEPIDIYMTSPPCQAFSLAGKRKGEDDKRGILFYNSHEFIKENKPRYFIFENVKGLLSDDKGNTFAKWVQYLGGKSVNGNPTLFPHEESLPYHIYWKVLNAKDYNIPQNRERVFIIGIRDDEDNNFTWPKEMFLERRLRDVLESDVDEKYYLSEKMISYLTDNQGKRALPFVDDKKEISNCIVSVYHKTPTDGQYLKVKSATKQGYELAEVGEDSINFERPESKTRRGRVGVGVGQTLTTSCNQGVAIGAIRGRNPNNPTSRISGQPTQQMLEINQNGTSNALTTVQKDNVVVEGVNVVANLPGKHEQNSRVYGTNGLSPTLTTMQGGGQEPKIAEFQGIGVHPFSKKLEFDGFKDRPCPTLLATDYKAPKCVQYSDYRIRKLTPRECFRLMDFPDTFSWPVSDSQAYKQAGNSICVGVLSNIIEKLKL